MFQSKTEPTLMVDVCYYILVNVVIIYVIIICYILVDISCGYRKSPNSASPKLVKLVPDLGSPAPRSSASECPAAVAGAVSWNHHGRVKSTFQTKTWMVWRQIWIMLGWFCFVGTWFSPRTSQDKQLISITSRVSSIRAVRQFPGAELGLTRL